jgi:hypothetical protein
MQRISTIVLLALGLMLIGGLVPSGFRPATQFSTVVHAAPPQSLTLDVAVDCRTVVSGTTRAAVFMISGKLFPGGTFPSTPAGIDPHVYNVGNDPVQSFNGVSPIGEYLVRGQHAVNIPLNLNDAFFTQHYISSTAPLGAAIAYFLLKGGTTALLTDGYDLGPNLPPPGALFTITGGIGDYAGATGDAKDIIVSSNATGCANSRTTFNIIPGSMRGSSNN